MNQHTSDTLKHVGDAISVGTLLGTLTAWLPPIAAFVTIIWTLMRIPVAYDEWKARREKNKNSRPE